MKKSVGILLLLTAIGCKSETRTFQIPNISRVFMHEPGRYTFYSHSIDNTQLTTTIIRGGVGKNISRPYDVFFIDVEPGLPIWARYQCESSSWSTFCCDEQKVYNLEIHIHNSSEINPGGWNHGKFGKGTTIGIE